MYNNDGDKEKSRDFFLNGKLAMTTIVCRSFGFSIRDDGDKDFGSCFKHIFFNKEEIPLERG